MNPTGLDLMRSWEMEIDKSAILSDSFVHGSIVEKLVGILSDEESVETIGTITMVRFRPNELIPLELP